MATINREVFEKLPYEIVEIDREIYEKLEIPDLLQSRKELKNVIAESGVLVGPKKYCFHPYYKQCGLDMYNFKSRPDDVWILGIMRSGTTLTSELSYLLVNNLNYQNASETDLINRVPNLEYSLVTKAFTGPKAEDLFRSLNIDINRHLKALDATENKRCIRTHLPISLLPPHVFDIGAKVIYCARNPKDVIVSNYNLFLLSNKDNERTISFEKYFRIYKANILVFLPHFEHLKEGWSKRNDPNFLFIFYEDTLKDKAKTIKRIAEFLEIDITDAGIDKLEDHLDINNFKKNKSLNMEMLNDPISGNGFIRKGQPGEWKSYFKGDLEREVDDWMEENLKGTDIKFPIFC